MAVGLSTAFRAVGFLLLAALEQPPRFCLRLGVRTDMPISSSGHRARRWAGGMPMALGPGRVTHPTQGPLCACAGLLPELTCAAAGAQQKHQPLWALQQPSGSAQTGPSYRWGNRLFHVLTVRLISGLKPWRPGGYSRSRPQRCSAASRRASGVTRGVLCSGLRSGLFPGRGCSSTGQRTWAGACGPSRTSPRAPSSASK